MIKKGLGKVGSAGAGGAPAKKDDKKDDKKKDEKKKEEKKPEKKPEPEPVPDDDDIDGPGDLFG